MADYDRQCNQRWRHLVVERYLTRISTQDNVLQDFRAQITLLYLRVKTEKKLMQLNENVEFHNSADY